MKKPIEILAEQVGIKNAVKWVTIVEEMIKADNKENKKEESPVA